MVQKTSDNAHNEDVLDVSELLEGGREPKNIIPQPENREVPQPEETLVTPMPQEQPSASSRPVMHNFEDRIQDDLKQAFEVQGFLDMVNPSYGFLRPEFAPSNNDIYVSMSQIRKFQLRQGDLVQGLARPPKQNERFHGLLKITKINDQNLKGDTIERKKYETLTAIYPDRQIVMEYDPQILSTRIIDLFAPIGFGQRGLVVSPPKAGKTTILKEIAAGISANHPKVHIIAALIGERPEEVTDMKRSIKGEVVASNFDESPEHQTKVAELGLERAKRLVEMGQDVVIILDSITRLARAYNLCVGPSGKTLSGGFDPAALYPAKKFLGAARNCEEGGSLTIIGTALVDTGSRMDDLIYEEFKGTGNMELHLDRKLADRRIFPAINIERSGTRHDEQLLSKDTFAKVSTLHHMLLLLQDEERLMSLIDKLKKTKSNKDILNELKNG
ncbi:MAG: transcription termination factor Rho [Candidatus Roizmanbacteria bacterium]|nr:transcription termination factor Rho [Candidatus Roizmanbacteria bacterium]